MYTMRATEADITRYTDLPNVEEAVMINLTQYNIGQTELLFWLDNNTKVKHVLKDEEHYYIFFKDEDEYKRLSEFLVTVFVKAA